MTMVNQGFVAIALIYFAHGRLEAATSKYRRDVVVLTDPTGDMNDDSCGLIEKKRKCSCDLSHQHKPPPCYNTSQPGPFFQDCKPATELPIPEGEYNHGFIRCCAMNFTSILWYENTTYSGYQRVPLITPPDSQQENRYLVDKNQSMFITGQAKYQGHYFCEVTNQGTGETIINRVLLKLTSRIDCHEPPAILKPNTSTTLHRLPGESFAVECVGYIQQCNLDTTFPTIAWSRWVDGQLQPIKPDSNPEFNLTLPSSHDPSTMRVTLHVKTVSQHLYGKYVCIAANLWGNTNSTVTLQDGSDVQTEQMVVGLVASVVVSVVVILALAIIITALVYTRFDLDIKYWYFSKTAKIEHFDKKVLIVSEQDDENSAAFLFAQHFGEHLKRILCHHCEQSDLSDIGMTDVEHEHLCADVKVLQIIPGQSSGAALEEAAEGYNFVIYIMTEPSELKASSSLMRFFQADIAERFLGSIFVLYKCTKENLESVSADNIVMKALHDAILANTYGNFAIEWPDCRKSLQQGHRRDYPEQLPLSQKQKVFWKKIKYSLLKSQIHHRGTSAGIPGTPGIMGMCDERLLFPE